MAVSQLTVEADSPLGMDDLSVTFGKKWPQTVCIAGHNIVTGTAWLSLKPNTLLMLGIAQISNSDKTLGKG